MTSISDTLAKRLAKAEDDLKKLQSNPAPTVPKYDLIGHSG